MDIDPKSIEALRSARRMEIKAKSAFCGGLFEETDSVVLGGSEAVPDPHFNRISVIEPEKLDEALLAECIAQMPDGVPMFIDILYPLAGPVRDLLLKSGWHLTAESRSSMLLTQYQDSPPVLDGLKIESVTSDTIDAFVDLFLRGFDTPEALIPPATEVFCDLIPKNCKADKFRLYLGTFRGEPACTQFLFFAGGEGGISMVSTKEQLRGKGLATAMLHRVMDDARELSVRLLSLETKWSGAPERLYRKLGFTTIARHEVFANVADLKYGV